MQAARVLPLMRCTPDFADRCPPGGPRHSARTGVATGAVAADPAALRYITRPALSDERVQINAAGQVELKLKTPWRDGTTHLVMSPPEFMQRLAA